MSLEKISEFVVCSLLLGFPIFELPYACSSETMEVASPLTSLRPSPGGGGVLSNKRSCSPAKLLDVDGIPEDRIIASQASKRRRFHAPSEIDSLSADFSSQTVFFNSNKNNVPSSQQKGIFGTNGGMSYSRWDAS